MRPSPSLLLLVTPATKFAGTAFAGFVFRPGSADSVSALTSVLALASWVGASAPAFAHEQKKGASAPEVPEQSAQHQFRLGAR
jgi:hypothetical protein